MDMDTKISDLTLSLYDSWVGECIEIVKAELKTHNLELDVSFWISDDWFCPDGVVGIGIPFYLLTPELIKIEKQEIGKAEGSTKRECLRIIRHELGHAIDNAFKLRTFEERQNLFGDSDKRYPASYIPKFYSQKYVTYLGDGYAQSHPDEDWAETFAVWLDPDSNWKSKYQNMECMTKLLYIDKIMREIPKLKQKVFCKKKVDHFTNDDRTLREYFNQKRRRLKISKKRRIPFELKKISTNCNESSLANFLNKNKVILKSNILSCEELKSYEVDKTIQELIVISKQNRLGLKRDTQTPKIKVVSKFVQNYTLKKKLRGDFRIYM
ncbi:MAG: putative zinc-binding metallopeptidase [Halobacteriovoraceae bacterium]|nr:putative zinc-binding metallopeptidase [Halobacteriovoraceae bacterium]